MQVTCSLSKSIYCKLLPKQHGIASHYNARTSSPVHCKGRLQSLTEIRYLYSVKIEGEGVRRIWLCKDTELTLKKAFRLQINDSNQLISS